MAIIICSQVKAVSYLYSNKLKFLGGRDRTNYIRSVESEYHDSTPLRNSCHIGKPKTGKQLL